MAAVSGKLLRWGHTSGKLLSPTSSRQPVETSQGRRDPSSLRLMFAVCRLCRVEDADPVAFEARAVFAFAGVLKAYWTLFGSMQLFSGVNGVSLGLSSSP